MSTRELAYNILDALTEEQLQAFVTLFGKSVNHIPEVEPDEWDKEMITDSKDDNEEQEKKQQERLLKAIYALPILGDIKKMSGENNLYRLRVGDFRLLFEMSPKSNKVNLIDVTNADNRGQIYK